MAISAGSKLLWSDMSSLFSRISAVRQKFGYSTINPSSYGSAGSYAVVANIQNMKDLLTAVKGNGYAASAVNAFTIAVPSFGDIIRASTMTPIVNMIGALEGACIFDNFSFNTCTDFRSFTFNSCTDFRSFSFNSCNVYDSFTFNSCNGFNSFNGNVASCSYFNTSFTYNGRFSCAPYNLSVTYN